MEMHRCVCTKNSHASQHIQKSFKIQPEEGTQQEPNSGMGPAVAFVESGKIRGPELFWELCFPVLFCFFGSVFLPDFLAICSILELEAAISTIFATFWSWNLSFSIEFARFLWNL